MTHVALVRATSATAGTCWSASTRSASRATCFTPRGAIAAPSSIRRWRASLKKGGACSVSESGRDAHRLANKIRAYELQDQGFDTVEANERLGFKPDQRDYGIGAQILSDLGVTTMRLLTNNPRKFVGLQGYGLSVSEAVALEIPASESTRKYLKTKKDKLGHKLSSV
jgi:GTP cyclohydrolase II